MQIKMSFFKLSFVAVSYISLGKMIFSQTVENLSKRVVNLLLTFSFYDKLSYL